MCPAFGSTTILEPTIFSQKLVKVVHVPSTEPLTQEAAKQVSVISKFVS
jgi:hypothetical protein